MASFCASAVQNSVTWGSAALYAARSAGVSTTEFRCETTAHARPTRSVAASSGSANVDHVGAAADACSRAISARADASTVAMAGSTSAGRIAS